MDVADLKKLLTASKREPVKCAVGISKDGNAALTLHKTKAGPALVKILEDESGKLASHGFGEALVDTDADPKLVVLTLNKPIPGVAKKLKKTLKGTGFTKVEIRLDDGTVVESAADEEAEEHAAAADAPPAAAAPPPPATPPAPPGQDMAKLSGAMPALIKQVQDAVAADPSRAAALKHLAADAISAVKGQDVEAATKAVDALREQLAPGTATSATAAGQPSIKAIQADFAKLVPTFAAASAGDPARMENLRGLAGQVAAAIKANDAGAAGAALATIKETLAQATAKTDAAPVDIWREAKETVDGKIAELQKACLNHPSPALRAVLAEVVDKGLNGVTGRASVGMMAAMMQAAAAPDKARSAMDTLRSFLATPVAESIDDNPFSVKVEMRATFNAAMDSISKRLAA